MNMNPQEDVNEYFKTKRDQYMVQIRKKKQTDTIKAKRAKLALINDKENVMDNPEEEDFSSISQKIHIHAESIQEAFKVQNLYDLKLALKKLRIVLSQSDEPPVKAVIITGVVADIAKILDEKFKNNEDLLTEASWILTNIASGESHFVVYLLDLKIVEKAMWLLDHPNLELKENAVWILSNIAGDSIRSRDMLIEKGLVEKMDSFLLRNDFTGSLLQQSVWLISNLCGGKPYPEYHLVAPLLMLLQKLIMTCSDVKVLQYTLWTFLYLADGENPGQIEEIINLDVAERFIELLDSDESEIRIPASRLLGVMLSGEDYQVEYLTNLGLIEPLARYLKSSKRILRRNACFAISNILSASEQEIDKVLNYNNGYIIKKFSEMVYEGDQEIAFEILICFGNLCCARVLDQIDVAVKHGLLSIIGDSMKAYDDIEITRTLLEMVDSILIAETDNNQDYDGNGPYYKELQANGVFTRIENLADHDSKEISNLVAYITDKHLQFE